MKLKNKVALVTGGGAGIGLGIVKAFLQSGASVVIADINFDLAKANVAGLKGNIEIVQADVSKRDQIEKAIDIAVEKFGRLDILVNNAGILDKMTPLHDVTDELWNKVMSINLDGVMYASRKALQVMLGQGQGNIINIGSVCSTQGGRGGLAYTTAKHALVGLSKNVAFVYADKNIRCNIVCPGSIKTEIATDASNFNALGMEKALLGLSANPKHGEPDDIANLVLFLASEDSKYINGSVIVADSGWTAY